VKSEKAKKLLWRNQKASIQENRSGNLYSFSAFFLSSVKNPDSYAVLVQHESCTPLQASSGSRRSGFERRKGEGGGGGGDEESKIDEKK
jgi:hypothetical protein